MFIKFFISNKIAGKSITESTVKKLLKDKKTNVMKEFKSKEGKEFHATLVLQNGQVKFHLDLDKLGKKTGYSRNELINMMCDWCTNNYKVEE